MIAIIPRPHAIRGVIFDLDGLMLDTERIAFDAWMRAGSELGLPITESIVRSMIGRTGPDSDAILLGEFGSDVSLDRLKERRLAHTDAHMRDAGIGLKKGLSELLAFLDEREIAKAVATSSGYDRAMMKLRRAKIDGRFPVIISGDHVRRGKPAPDIYEAAAAALQLGPDECLALEDSDAGVRAAHAARMAVIMVPDIAPPAEDVRTLAFRIESSLSDVLALLPGLVAPVHH